MNFLIKVRMTFRLACYKFLLILTSFPVAAERMYLSRAHSAAREHQDKHNQ
jgi:hypothetical protein